MDKLDENDDTYKAGNLNFIANKGLVEEYGEFEIQYSDLGFRLLTEKTSESSCGSCSGSCS